jgi:hypothetical protein
MAFAKVLNRSCGDPDDSDKGGIIFGLDMTKLSVDRNGGCVNRAKVKPYWLCQIYQHPNMALGRM